MILLKNCLLLDSEDKNQVKKTAILIENQKISKIDEEIDPPTDNFEVIDLKEKYVTPGFIDCHTHLGIIEEAVGKIGVDNNETSNPVTPHLRGIDAINPFDVAFGDAIRSGVTCVMSGPGSNNAVGGQSAVLKTHGHIIDNMLVKNPVGLKIALGENPLSTYGVDDKVPVTRMGTVALIRELFMKTQDYIVLKEKRKITYRDIQLEAVIPLLKGEISLRVHAHRADDIVTAIRLAKEFNVNDIVIEHGTEANLVKEILKENNVPVAYGPILTPRIKMELKLRNIKSILELIESGINVAFITDHPYNSIDHLRTVTALAIAEGLEPHKALDCITATPAKILSLENRIGRIKSGFDADLVVHNGNPLDINSKVLMTMINGKIVYNTSDIKTT